MGEQDPVLRSNGTDRSDDAGRGVAEALDLESDLIDVTRIELEKLAGLPESAFTVALHRIFDETAAESDLYTGFREGI